MRTMLVFLAATLVLAFCAGAAAASPLLGARVELGDVQVALDVPSRLPSTAGAGVGFIVEPSLPRSPFLAPSLPLVEIPLELAAPSATVRALPLPQADAQATIEGPAPPPAPPAAVQTAAATGILWLLIERLGFGRAIGGALAALYFRVQPNELLDHERRERVVQLVRERPGIGPSDVANALGTGWGVTSYHLDRLERAGLVTSQRVGQHRCYFLPGAVPRDQQRTVGLFRGDTTRRVAELVRERPGMTQSELCAALGLSASAASKQVSRLEAAALVRREAGNGGQRVYPAPLLAGALAPSTN